MNSNSSQSRKISLVISDVDGTLINQDKVLTEKTKTAIAKLEQAGILFTVTSARPPFGMKMIIDTLKIQHPFGAFNGGLILKPDFSVISCTPLAPQIMPDVITTIEDFGLDVWLCSNDHWYLKDPQGVHVDHHSQTLKFEPTMIENYQDIEDGVIKIVGVGKDVDTVAQCETATQEKFRDRLSATRSQPYYLDITQPDANKGQVVTKLADYLSIPLAEIVTIGDNYNDIAMFKQSGISIAMGNASERVQQKATYITTSNQEEGFANAIERFVLG
ncbi:MAG: Cof-type HAD-IIB family hydrolase [Cyanobacteria bacterium P01_G01_bin.67]